MNTLSVVIPAFNERHNIAQTLRSIPVERLKAAGTDVEVLVVDNGSTDGTGKLARELGARVLVQPVRGYGNAYKAGFENSSGDIIATGDADLTYPFEVLPEALGILQDQGVDFLSTNRLDLLRADAMTRPHVWGNRVLSSLMRGLFQSPFRDSQSGMWIFYRKVWEAISVHSGGMAFSEEIKLEAYRRGFRCAELPIVYLPRGGKPKLRGVRDGARVAASLFLLRTRSYNGLYAAHGDRPGRYEMPPMRERSAEG